VNSAGTGGRIDEVNEFSKKLFELQELHGEQVGYVKLAAMAADHVRAMKAGIAKERREAARRRPEGGRTGS